MRLKYFIRNGFNTVLTIKDDYRGSCVV